MKFTTTVAVSLGGVVFPAGDHDAKVEQDWFFNALVADGALTVTEDDALEAVVVDTDARNAMKQEADALGIQYPNNIKTDKLSQLIADKKALDEASVEASETVADVVPEVAEVPNPADVAV